MLNKKFSTLMSTLFMTAILSSCYFSNGDSGDAPTHFYAEINLNTKYNESIAALGVKTYKFTTTAAGPYTYTFALTNLASDCAWTLCSYDPSAASPCDLIGNILDNIHGNLHFDTTSEIYTLPLAAATNYFLVVDEWGPDKWCQANSSYTLEIIH